MLKILVENSDKIVWPTGSSLVISKLQWCVWSVICAIRLNLGESTVKFVDMVLVLVIIMNSWLVNYPSAQGRLGYHG